MKLAVAIYVGAFLLMLTGCPGKNNLPDTPTTTLPEVTTTTLAPVTTTTMAPVTTTLPAVTTTTLPAADCSVKMFQCYKGWGACDGFYADYASTLAALRQYDPTGCHRIDGVMVDSGFGPCAECRTIVTAMSAKIRKTPVFKYKRPVKK